MPQTKNTIKQLIIKDADICVRCGLCLPHCPTYNLNEDESESPRGRIAIAKAIAQDKIPLTDKAQLHLNHCLSCQACEAMCPANVPYTQLMNATQVVLQQQKPKSTPVFLKILIDYPRRINTLNHLLWLYQKLGMHFLLRKTGLLKLFGLDLYSSFLPKLSRNKPWKNYYPTTSTKIADVALFKGCVNGFLDESTLRDAIFVLNAYGFGVYVPKSQGCCSAIDLHSGNSHRVEKLTSQNKSAFDDLAIKAIISIASGCANTLKDYQNKPVRDICDFLLDYEPPKAWQKEKIDDKILIHSSCTLRNGLKCPDSAKLLLSKLGFSNISAISHKGCCGAAGMHMWKYPNTSKQLAKPIINEVLALKPKYLISSNIGCILHIKHILKEKGQKIRIEHPVSLIFKGKMQKNLKKLKKNSHK